MWTIIIFAVAGLLYGIKNAYEDSWGEFFEYFAYSLMGVIGGAIIGFAVAVILPMDLYIREYSYSILTLQDNTSVTGRSYLFHGSIDGTMKYSFYTEDQGYFKLHSIDYSLVRIKYTDGEPVVNVFEKYYTDSWINKFALDLDVFDKTYTIEVPKGSIVNGFSLDAK